MTSPPAAGGAGRLAPCVKWLLILLILANAAGTLLRPIGDPDFFWHLKTGEWIWEHRSLPDRFLFVSHPPGSSAVIQRFTMTSYWMTQVLFHLAHAAGGMCGIGGLRLALYASLMLMLVLGKEGDDLVFLGLLPPAAAVLAEFPIERPQYVSFVFFGLLLVLLGGIRSARSPAAARLRAAAVPLLMVVWANCHGGYVVGLGILAVWLLAESVKLLDPRLGPLPPERHRLLLAAGAAGLLASFINPNTYHVFEVAVLPAWHTRFVQEYRSTIEIYRFYADSWILVYWALLALAIAALALSWRRPDLTSIALVAVTGYFSFTQIRHIPFFLVAAALVTCRHLSAAPLVARARVPVAALGLAVGLLSLRTTADLFRESPLCPQVNSYLFPVAAADFIESAGLRGNMFNLYAWGGYLLWRLAPAEVIIDGRNSDQDRYEAYLLALKGEGAAVHGLPYWKQYFATRNIRYTVTSAFDALSGQIHGLLDHLLADPSWALLLQEPNLVVFAEDVPENHDAIARHALPKEQFYPQLLANIAGILSGQPDFVQARVARGEALLRLGDEAGALRAFEDALRIAPRQPVALARAATLRAPRVERP